MEVKRLTADRFVDMRTGIMYRYVHSDTEYFRPHDHDYCEVFLVLEGAAQHLINGRIIHLSQRDIVFIRPQDTHDYIPEPGRSFSMLNITFTCQTVEEIFSFLGEGFPGRALMAQELPPATALSTADFEALEARMRGIRAISRHDVPRLKAALRMLLFEIMTAHFCEPAPKEEAMPSWLDALCRRMREGGFVEGAEPMFAGCDKSREHICRSMKTYTGMTVTEFINGLRLNYIANMLQNSNHTVTEIIFDSGFNNISWASRLFKEKYGESMRQYRKNSWNTVYDRKKNEKNHDL